MNRLLALFYFPVIQPVDKEAGSTFSGPSRITPLRAGIVSVLTFGPKCSTASVVSYLEISCLPGFCTSGPGDRFYSVWKE